jgi:hypothetical protein
MITFWDFVVTVGVGVASLSLFFGSGYLLGLLFPSETSVWDRVCTGCGLILVTAVFVILIAGVGGGVSALMGLDGPFQNFPHNPSCQH